MSALTDLVETADILGSSVTFDYRAGHQSIMVATIDDGRTSVPIANRNSWPLRSYDNNDGHHYLSVWSSGDHDPDQLCEITHRELLDLAFAAVAW